MSAPETPADGVPPVMSAGGGAGLGWSRGRWWIHLLLLGAYPVVLGILGAKRTGAEPALTHDARGLLMVCGLEATLFSGVFGLAWMASRASSEELLLRWRPGFWVVPLGVAYSIGVRLVMGIVAMVVVAFLLLGHFTSVEAMQRFTLANRPDVATLVDINALRHDPAYYWLTLTVVSFVVAGLREELWRSGCLAGLRALWPRWFGSGAGQFAAVAITAVIFGLGHMSQGVLAVGGTAVLGFVLGAIMVLHRSIWPAVLAHGMFDATTFALLPWLGERLQTLR